MFKFKLSEAADKAAKKLEESKDKSRLTFFRITEQVVRGAGVTNPSHLAARARDVRNELRRRSAAKRRAEAVAKQLAKKLAS